MTLSTIDTLSDELLQWALIVGIGVGAYALWRSYSLGRDAVEIIDDGRETAVTGTVDLAAELTGLAQYERDLLHSSSPEEVAKIREAWNRRTVWCGYRCQRRKQ